jgi:hypothetical protein
MKDLDRKRSAVAERIATIGPNINVLAGMWDERTVDILILIFGIGVVELHEMDEAE